MAGLKKGKNRKSKEHINSQKPISTGHELSPRSSSYNTEFSEDDKINFQIYYQIHEKIEDAFKMALDRLMMMNYSYSTAEKAMLRGGQIIGENSMVTNIVRSSVSYIENCTKVDGEYVQDDFPFCENAIEYVAHVWIETLADMAILCYSPKTTRRDLMWDMLHCNLLASHVIGSAETANSTLGKDENGFDIFLRTHTDQIVEGRGITSRLPFGGQQDEASSSRVPKSSTAIERKQLSVSAPVRKNLKSSIAVEWLDEYSTLQEWFENSPDEEDEKVIKLKNLVSYLEAQVKEKQDWAEKKEREVAEKEGKHSLLLGNLRQETSAIEGLRKEKKCLETVQISKILATDSEIERQFEQLQFLNKKKGEIQQDSSDLRADLSVWKEDIPHLKKQLKQATKKEKKDLQTLEGNGLEIMKLEELKLDSSKLHHRLRDANEAQKKIQSRLKMEKAAKEKANQLCLEERRLLKMEDEIEQQRLQASIQREPELQNEDFRRIKEFADRQMTPYPMLANGAGGYVSREVGIHSYRSEIPHHKRCVKCNRKEACVLFIPCSHSVVCWDCNARVQDCCPLCQCQVEQKIAICEERAGSSDYSA